MKESFSGRECGNFCSEDWSCGRRMSCQIPNCKGKSHWTQVAVTTGDNRK